MYIERRARQSKQVYTVRLYSRGTREARTFSTLAAAKEWGRVREQELSKLAAGNYTFADVLSCYRTSSTPKGLAARRPGTQRHYNRWLDELETIIGGSTPVKDVTPERLAEVRDIWCSRGSQGAARVGLMAASAAYQCAITAHHMKVENPVRKIFKPAPYEARTHTLSVSEIKRLLAACGAVSDDIYLGASIAITTGCRRGEIESLRWEYISGGTLTLPGSATKSGRAHRVHLQPEVVRMLAKRDRSSAWVFFHPSNKSQWRRLDHDFLKARKLAGLSVRFHDLRHTFAKLVLSRGGSMPMLMCLLNHSNPSTTRRYSHFEVTAADALTSAAVGGLLDG